MFATTFYHQLIRKYTAVFGTLFNNIHINRVNENADAVQTFKVPIAYAPKDKILARLVADPNLDRPVAITLPRMSFEMRAPYYDSTRKISNLNRITRQENGVKSVYSGAPYNINFSLYIYVKNVDDGTRIVEQILPYFTPDYTVTVNIIDEMSIKTDIPISLSSVEMIDEYEGNFDQRKVLIWQLDFVMKTYFYGPVSSPKVIKFTNNSILNLATNTEMETISVQPGLTANGEPTSNISLSISYLDINGDDDYGYITTIE